MDTNSIIIIFPLGLFRPIAFIVKYLLRVGVLVIHCTFLVLIDDNGAHMHKYHIVPHF